MENPLRACHIAEDGTFRLHFPETMSRRASHAEASGGPLGEEIKEFKSDAPVPLWQLLAMTSLEGITVRIFDGESDEEHIARTAAISLDCITRKGFQQSRMITVHKEIFPVRDGDAMFRPAWRCEADKVTVDLNVAREIVLAQIREVRNKKLDESDRDKQRLDDIGTDEEKQKLAMYRQSLRDLPSTVSEAIAKMDVVDLYNYKPTMPVNPLAAAEIKNPADLSALATTAAR